MHNLALFLLRYHALFLFVLLEAVALYWVVHRNERQSRIFSAGYYTAVGGIQEQYNSFVHYLKLRNDNDSLNRVNAQLRAENRIASMYLNRAETGIIEDSLFKRKYVYIAAEVINNNTNKYNNYLTLNRGSLHGVRPGSGVLNGAGDGIVGIVRHVSPHYAVVMSVLNRSTKISAKIKGSGFFGSMSWDGTDVRHMQLSAIPKHANVSKGDLVVTSGYSVMFPPGIRIGTVDTVYLEGGSNFYTIQVLLSCDMNNIQYAHVVNNLMTEEQLELEKKVQSE